MGIYYYAVDTTAKKYFTAPGRWANKAPGCYHPSNPFPSMLVMQNVRGAHYRIWDDLSNDIPPDEGYTDVTNEVWDEYRDMFRECFDTMDNTNDSI